MRKVVLHSKAHKMCGLALLTFRSRLLPRRILQIETSMSGLFENGFFMV